MSAPVVVSVETEPPALRRGDAAVRRDRKLAERCLVQALERAGAPIGFTRDADGIPQPAPGWHASWTHTRGRVASVVAREPIGIDLEWLGRQASPALHSAATQDERLLLPRPDVGWQLRLWTVKEALLKQRRLGLGGLSRCRLSAPPRGIADSDRFVWSIALDDERCDVQQQDLGEHSLALAGPSGAALIIEQDVECLA